METETRDLTEIQALLDNTADDEDAPFPMHDCECSWCSRCFPEGVIHLGPVNLDCCDLVISNLHLCLICFVYLIAADSTKTAVGALHLIAHEQAMIEQARNN